MRHRAVRGFAADPGRHRFPAQLDLRGRSNLYGRMRTYLEPMQKGEGAETIDDFGRWKDTPSEIREVDTVLATNSVWKSPQPLQDLLIEQDNPTQPFQLATALLKSSFFGARQGPYNARLADPVHFAGPRGESGTGTAKSGPERASDPIHSAATAGAETAVPKNTGDSSPAANTAGSAGDGRMPMPSAPADLDEDKTTLPSMPPMSIPPTPDTAHPRANAEGSEPGVSKLPAREPPASRRATQVLKGLADDRPGPAQGVPGGSDPQRRAVHQHPQPAWLQRRDAQDRPRRRSRIAGDGVCGIGTVVDRGRVGFQAPRIRFRPSPFAAKSTTAWSVLFNLRSGGSLHLQGLDLLIPDQDSEASRCGRQAAIGVSAGSELALNDCTISVAGCSSTSAAVVVQPGTVDETPSGGQRTIKNAFIKIRDGFVRSAGDCISVASGRLLDLQLQNVLIGADGSLLHALGSARSSAPEPPSRSRSTTRWPAPGAAWSTLRAPSRRPSCRSPTSRPRARSSARPGRSLCSVSMVKARWNGCTIVSSGGPRRSPTTRSRPTAATRSSRPASFPATTADPSGRPPSTPRMNRPSPRV